MFVPFAFWPYYKTTPLRLQSKEGEGEEEGGNSENARDVVFLADVLMA